MADLTDNISSPINDKEIINLTSTESKDETAEEKLPSSIFYPQIIQLRETVKPSELKDHDIDRILLRKIKRKIGNRCIRQGYVDENSIRILTRSIGKINTAHFNGEIYYNIKCEVNICLPAEGDKIKCKVLGKNRAGICCVNRPIQIILPTAHIEDKSLIDKINKDDDIIVEITRVHWELDQKTVDAIGRFVSRA
jgi:hypothetical protein